MQIRLGERFRRSAVAVIDSYDIGYAEQIKEELEWFTSVNLEDIDTTDAAKSYQGESDAKVVQPQSMY